LTTDADWKPSNAVAIAGDLTLVDWRQWAGGRFLWSPGSFGQATTSTGRQIIAAPETLVMGKS